MYITDKLVAALDDDCNLVREIKDSVREDLLVRYTDEEMITLIDKSTSLDPSLKRVIEVVRMILLLD